MRVLDLFSGIGGFSLGLERAGMKTVAFCEIDPFCQKVLKKHWPDVPIFEDVRTLNYDGAVDLICGGYPCQPFSVAGERKGQDDDRHLWPAMFRLIKKYRPAWVLGENVAGHISMGLDQVLADLEGEGYSTRAFVIPACALDAPHRRDRVWIVANHNSKRGWLQQVIPKCEDKTDLDNHGQTQSMANAQMFGRDNGKTESSRKHQRQGFNPRKFNLEWRSWLPEPRIRRVVDGVSAGIYRTARIKALGNSVVPQILEMIGRAIMEIEADHGCKNTEGFR